MNNFDRFQFLKRKTKLVSEQDASWCENKKAANNVKPQKNTLVEKDIDEYASEMKIAAFAPHADDIELGCGATIARLIEQNNAKLYYYVFIARKRTLEGEEVKGDGMERLRNCKSSFKFLISGESELDDFESQSDEFVVARNGKWGKFKFICDCSQKELYLSKEQIFSEIRRLQVGELSDVDIVFTPSFTDVHHDHQTLANVCFQVFRKQENLLYYKTPDSRVFPHERFNPNIFVESSVPIDPEGIYKSLLSSDGSCSKKITYADVKLKLISLFQTEKNSLWFDNDLFLNGMKTNAYDVYMPTSTDKEKFAEAFEGIVRI